MKSKKILYSIFAGAILSTFAFVFVAHANPLRLTPTTQTTTATTSVTFMSPGAATTTLTYDTFANAGGTTVADKVLLLEQLTASSTSSTLLTNIEYSNDGIDWYQKGIDATIATTTTPIQIGLVPQYSFVFASSTPGLGAVGASNNLDSRAIVINAPTRYIRAIFTLKIGGTNGAIWAQVVPLKQTF